jgi:hypothetical protein
MLVMAVILYLTVLWHPEGPRSGPVALSFSGRCIATRSRSVNRQRWFRSLTPACSTTLNARAHATGNSPPPQPDIIEARTRHRAFRRVCALLVYWTTAPTRTRGHGEGPRLRDARPRRTGTATNSRARAQHRRGARLHARAARRRVRPRAPRRALTNVFPTHSLARSAARPKLTDPFG